MDSQWLNKQFEIYPDRTKAGLAKALGLEPPAVSKILKGMRQIKAKEYAIMRRYFGLPVEGDRQDTSIRTHGVQNPFFADDGARAQAEWALPAELAEGDVSRRVSLPEKVKVYEIEDEMMLPHWRRGECVLVDLSDKEPDPAGVFVLSDGYNYLVRLCRRSGDFDGRAEVEISAYDKNFIPQILAREEVQIIGRVVATLRWVEEA